MSWFRMPTSLILHDPLVGTLPDSTFRFWINCLCVSSGRRLNGNLPGNEDLAFYARCEPGKVAHHIDVLVSHGIFGIDASGRAFVRDWKKHHDRRYRAIPAGWAALRLRVFKRDNFTCQYCGASGVKLHCDHITPLSRGGDYELDNLTTACSRCNCSKRDKSVSEWRRPS